MKPTLLIISQVYVPDPTAVGQYMHDAAAAMVQRGYRVVVYTSAQGYDDPAQRYPRRETRDGVTIRRLPFSSFGKSSIKVRLAAQLLFLAQAACGPAKAIQKLPNIERAVDTPPRVAASATPTPSQTLSLIPSNWGARRCERARKSTPTPGSAGQMRCVLSLVMIRI